MKSINIHNYEAYLLDYSEGILPAEEVAELLLFIETNPNLEIDLTDFGLTYLTPSNEKLEDKSFIKQFPRIEELVIGHTETLLTKEENKELVQFEKQYQEVAALKTAYKATILPKEFIEYPNKQSLKRTRVIPLYWISAVAAAIFIGILLTFNFDSNEQGAYAVAGNIEEIEKTKDITFPSVMNVAKFKVDTVRIKTNNAAKQPRNPENSNLAKTIETKKPITPVADASKDSSKAPQQDVPVLYNVDKNNIALTDNDTIITPVNNTSNDLAQVKTNAFTVKEFLKVKTKEIVLKEEDPNLAPINGKDLLASLAESVNAKTKMDVAYQNEESDSKKITKFKLGKIEFYKSASK